MPIIQDTTIAELTNSSLFKFSNSNAFNVTHSPGGKSKAPYAGIYQCTSCLHEIGIAKGHEFPPCGNVEDHNNTPLMPVMWQLVAAAKEKGAP